MTRYRVIDTNVAVVANGRDTQADERCQLACVSALSETRSRFVVVLDIADHIMTEYRRKLSPSGAPGLGDAFFKYLIDNRYNENRCKLVDIPLDPETGDFESFPNNDDLGTFDQDDRKFVAAALVCGKNCKILNAVDTDWRDHSVALADCGILVTELCPHEVE